MEKDPGGAQAAGLEGAIQVENWVQSGARLEDLTLGAPSGLQTQRDSPFRQKDGCVIRRGIFIHSHISDGEMIRRQSRWTCGIKMFLTLISVHKDEGDFVAQVTPTQMELRSRRKNAC